MQLLKELTEAQGTSGYEHPVREIMKRELEQQKLPIISDHLGSIFGEMKGSDDSPKIMVAGHMDEVGFMVKEITKDGFLYFAPLGGWWDQVLLAQRVHILTKQKTFTGVIGSKPPHILTPEERKKVYPMREMFIDVGAKDETQVKEWGIRVGDPIVPICPYELMPDGDTILAKALDNRSGCYMALEIVKQLQNTPHPNTVYAGATVQEEVGLRGAKTAPYAIHPDCAIVLDVGVAQDIPGNSDKNKPKLGDGPLITFLDATMIPNTLFRDFIVDTAESCGIPYQAEIMTGGGTDAGQIHMFKQGVPSIVIGAPARYIHSHTSMISKRDTENAVKLLLEVIRKFDADALKSVTRF